MSPGLSRVDRQLCACAKAPPPTPCFWGQPGSTDLCWMSLSVQLWDGGQMGHGSMGWGDSVRASE